MARAYPAKDDPAIREEREDEQYVRYRFFEQILAGRLSEQQIYDRAEALDLDLRAQAYTIAFVSAVTEQSGAADSYSEPGAKIRDGLVSYFLKYPEYVFLSWNFNTYAVLIKSDADSMDGCIRRCVTTVRELYETHGAGMRWHIAVGKPVRHLSGLPDCYEEAARLWAYRYILPDQHILLADTVRFLTGTGSDRSLDGLDVEQLSPAVITELLKDTGPEEISAFVDRYVHSLEEALQSGPFCQYLMLNVRFAATAFVQSLGVSRQEYLDGLDCLDMVGRNVTTGDLKRYLSEILLRAAELRGRGTGGRGRNLLKAARDYIDENYRCADISLNRTAREVKVSANYLSAVFSREMGMTFVEYLTARRMEKARELLRSTNLRSGQIAAAVGYQDPRYFSSLFRKLHGCTPRDYRAQK